MNMPKVFSFDAETNGLWGRAFALAAIVYNDAGEETARFVGRCPIQGEVNPWVRDNVLPQLAEVPETHGDYDGLLADFAAFYKANKSDADIVVHMGVPVESSVLRDMHDRGHIGDWDGPFPLHDLAAALLMVGENPTSVDAYAAKFGLQVRPLGSSHHPLHDSEVAARVWMHLRQRATAV